MKQTIFWGRMFLLLLLFVCDIIFDEKRVLIQMVDCLLTLF